MSRSITVKLAAASRRPRKGRRTFGSGSLGWGAGTQLCDVPGFTGARMAAFEDHFLVQLSGHSFVYSFSKT